MSARTGYSSTAGTCPTCTRETGNLARHVPHCRAKLLAEPAALARAAAHGLPDEMLMPAQRFQGSVTDLTVATLLQALESGVSVHQGGRHGWMTEHHCALSPARLAAATHEAIRTGLVRALSTPVAPQIRKVVVVPAPVHLRSARTAYGPHCVPGWSGDSLRRWRLVDDRDLVDCRDCLDAAY